jgi:hypothetical protein
MKQNDKRDANMSAMCRLMAKGIKNGYSLANVMTFLNESRNSDVKELIALHVELDKTDEFDAFEKECQKDSDWLRYTRPLRRNGRRVVVRYPDHYSAAQIEKDLEKGFTYLENADALVLEYEIEEYEKLLESERDIRDAFGIKTDNDIACQTAYEIAEENARREHLLSQIACDAVKQRVHYGTIIRFMREMLKDDKERTFFLQEYSNAQWRDGRFN